MLKLHKIDFIYTGLLLFLSIGSLIPVQRMRHRQGGNAVLYEDGRMIRTFNLNRDQVFHYHQADIEVKSHSIRVLKSDCPHQICVQTGAISSPAQTIVCVPNKLMIEIPAETTIHAVSY